MVVVDCDTFLQALLGVADAGSLDDGVALHGRDGRFKADEKSLENLLQNNALSSSFAQLFACQKGGTALRQSQLAALARDTSEFSLLARIQFFVRDLRCFKMHKSARARLERGATLEETADPSSFLSAVYFTAAEQRWLLAFPTAKHLPLRLALGLYMQGQRGAKLSVCTAHDLAPFYIDVFELPKNFDHSKPLLEVSWCSPSSRSCSSLFVPVGPTLFLPQMDREGSLWTDGPCVCVLESSDRAEAVRTICSRFS